MNIPTYITGTTQAQSYRLLRRNVYEVLEQYHLTPTYWSVLGIIIESKDGVRSSEIAAKLHVKAPLITIITHELASLELIKSVPHHFDRRAKLLAITPTGKRFVKNVEVSLYKMLTQLLNGLTEEELTAYHKVLTTIIANDGLMHAS